VATARLALGRWDFNGIEGEPAGAADGEGRFTIRGALPEHTSVIASAEGHAWATRRIRVLEGEHLAGVDIVVPETRTLVVTVSERGAPVTGAQVSAWSATGRGAFGWKAEGRTGANGLVRLEHVPTGRAEIWARNEVGEARVETDVTEQSETGASLTLQPVPRIAIEGRVTWLGSGAPAAVPVFLFCFVRGWDHTRADASGAYRFEGCPPGALHVQAFRREIGMDEWMRSYHSAKIRPDLARIDRTRTVDLTVAPGGKRIAGRVLLPDGRPAPSVLVTASGPLERRTSLTGAEGEFVFEDLTRQSHELTVKAGSHVPLEVPTKETDADGLVLRLAAGLRLRGTVVSPDGRPRPYTRVLARSPDGWAETHAGARGAFVLEGLVPGTYVLSVRGDTGEDMKVASVVVEPGREQNIRLLAAAPAAR
jgi:protocatechuate 3,4-dioxygenase beta subunit